MGDLSLRKAGRGFSPAPRHSILCSLATNIILGNRPDITPCTPSFDSLLVGIARAIIWGRHCTILGRLDALRRGVI